MSESYRTGQQWKARKAQKPTPHLRRVKNPFPPTRNISGRRHADAAKGMQTGLTQYNVERSQELVPKVGTNPLF